MPMKREPANTGLSDIFFSSFKHPGAVFSTHEAGRRLHVRLRFLSLAHIILLGRFGGEEEKGTFSTSSNIGFWRYEARSDGFCAVHTLHARLGDACFQMNTASL